MANQNATLSSDLKPKIIGYCSITRHKDSSIPDDRQFGSTKNLSYLNKHQWERFGPNEPLDLAEGFQGRNHVLKRLGIKLDTIVNWLQNDPLEWTRLLKRPETVYITFGGTVQTMMHVGPYRPNEKKWTTYIHVERYRNIIFLLEHKERDCSLENKQEYFGEKAEQLLLTSNPGNEKPDSEQMVPSMKEFCPFYEVKLNEESLLIYSAELDGIQLEEPLLNGDKTQILEILNTAPLIELKTAYPSLNDSQKSKWYRQATVTKVGQIYVVYKDGNGLARGKNILKTEDLLPENQPWNAREMKQRLLERLNFIKTATQEKTDLTNPFQFRLKLSQNNIKFNEIDRAQDKYKLLPNDFLKFVREGSDLALSNTNLSESGQSQEARRGRHDSDRGSISGDATWRGELVHEDNRNNTSMLGNRGRFHHDHRGPRSRHYGHHRTGRRMRSRGGHNKRHHPYRLRERSCGRRGGFYQKTFGERA